MRGAPARHFVHARVMRHFFDYFHAAIFECHRHYFTLFFAAAMRAATFHERLHSPFSSAASFSAAFALHSPDAAGAAATRQRRDLFFARFFADAAAAATDARQQRAPRYALSACLFCARCRCCLPPLYRRDALHFHRLCDARCRYFPPAAMLITRLRMRHRQRLYARKMAARHDAAQRCSDAAHAATRRRVMSASRRRRRQRQRVFRHCFSAMISHFSSPLLLHFIFDDADIDFHFISSPLLLHLRHFRFSDDAMLLH